MKKKKKKSDGQRERERIENNNRKRDPIGLLHRIGRGQQFACRDHIAAFSPRLSLIKKFPTAGPRQYGPLQE